MSVQVNEIIDQVRLGNQELVRELANNPQIAITHLMLACKEFCDPTELARQVNKVTPALRRGVFVEALVNAAAQQAQPEVVVEAPVEVVVAPADLPFQPDEPQQAKSAPSRTRKRAAAAPAEERVDVNAQPEAQQFQTQGISELHSALSNIADQLASVIARQDAMDKGISGDIGKLLTTTAEIERTVFSAVNAVNKTIDLLKEIDSKIERFRLGTESLEIELIAAGILKSAPFADSWAIK